MVSFAGRLARRRGGALFLPLVSVLMGVSLSSAKPLFERRSRGSVPPD